MPRACTTCLHPDLDAINRALVAGEAARTVASRFHVSAQSIQRHASNHLPVTLAKSPRFESEVKADVLLDDVQALKARAMGLLDTAEAGVAVVIGKGESQRVVSVPDLKAAVGAIREVRGCIELLAKLEGRIREGQTTVHVLQQAILSPEWLEFRRTLTAALRPYPDALEAAIAAFDAPKALAA